MFRCLFSPVVIWLCCLLLVPAVPAQEIAVAPTSPSLEVLRLRLEKLQDRVANGQAPADPQNLALLKFKIEQTQLHFQSIESNEAPFVLSSPYDATKETIEQTLLRAETVARATGDAVYPSLSPMHERAYIAQADGSVQPYWVFVPRDYTPRRQWPLVVFLHGYDPFLSKIKPWLPGPDIWEAATSRGFIMAVPYGRRNSDFVGIGEDDTMAVTDLVTKRYNVDADRTFLMGPSMGGFGVHAVGLHQPDRFAGLAPMCARTDFYLWFGLDRAALPPWKQVLYDADDPRHLKRNAFQLPIFMQHGALDNIVPVEHSRRFYQDLTELGHPVTYREIPYGTHFIYWEYRTFEAAVQWMQGLKRAPVPRRVQYTSGSLRNHRHHWVSIGGFRDYSRLAHIDAEIKPGNIVEVQTKNISRFELRLPPQFVDGDATISLFVDGVEAAQKYSANEPIRWQIVAGATALKTPLLSGPIKETYRDAFLLVYGTLQDGDDEKTARRFAKEWYDYADGRPPLKADREVTEADGRNYNLILFGTRESNSLLQEVSAKLPLELTPQGYRFGDREFATGEQKIGLQFCYPSPFGAGRMIVVQSGHFWGAALPVNHKLDLLPEYIVYSDALDPTDSTNQALVAGFFDDGWQLPAVAVQE